MIAKLTTIIMASLLATVFVANTSAQENQTLKANITQTNVTLAGNLSALQSQSQSQTNKGGGNASMAFSELANSTAILDQKLNQAEDNDNTTIRADVKAAVSELLNSLGNIGPKVREATAEQLQSLRASAEALVDGIQQILPGGNSGQD
jgi:uncharacterized protein YicC (UPF0701 family)